MKKSICAIVPAYNEESSIAAVIDDLKRCCSGISIVVVNDGSIDETEAVARAAGATVLSLPVNLGIGGAVQTGFIYARSCGCDITLQCDGDGQHPASEIFKLIQPLINGEADVVIGSRFLTEGGFQSSFTRRIGIRLISLTNWILTGQRILDNTSGFRAYNAEATAFLSENYPQDYPEPESMVELIRHGFRIKEVPVEMRARTSGQSSIAMTHSAYYITKVLLSNIISSHRGNHDV